MPHIGIKPGDARMCAATKSPKTISAIQNRTPDPKDSPIYARA
jgi:hypothetical protein